MPHVPVMMKAVINRIAESLGGEQLVTLVFITYMTDVRMVAKKKQKGELVAYVWWCGDFECNCHQPRIDRFTRSRKWRGRLPLHDIEPVWQGKFRSLCTPTDMKKIYVELKKKAMELGIETNKHGYGGGQEEL